MSFIHLRRWPRVRRHRPALLSAANVSTAATHLLFTTQPAGSTSGVALTTQPVVAAKNSSNATDTTKTGSVVVALNVVSGSPVLSGTTTKALASGVATFTDLVVTGAGTWTLTASLTGLTSDTSSQVTTPGNANPAQPTISAGTPTSSGVTLTGSAFSDTDVGDTHAASQWQVTTSADTGYAATVISTGDDATNKTSYAATGLSASTAYIARVRYKDSAGNYSAWSTSASFTTDAAGGIALVSHTAKGAKDTFTTSAIDTTGANFLVVGLTYAFAVSPVLSDSKGNTWTALTAKYSGNAADSRLYYCANPTVGTGHTFTMTGSSMFGNLTVAAFSGLLTASVLQVEGAGGAAAPGTSVQPGSVTPAADGYLVVTHLDWETATQTPSIGSGFTIADQFQFGTGVGSNYGGALAYLIQGTAAAVNPTWSFASDYVATTIAVFKKA